MVNPSIQTCTLIHNGKPIISIYILDWGGSHQKLRTHVTRQTDLFIFENKEKSLMHVWCGSGIG